MEKKKVNITSIQTDKAVTITIGGGFYTRLHKLGLEYGQGISEDTIIKALALIKADKAKEMDYAYNLETLLILLHNIEETFQKEGFTDSEDVEIDIDEKHKDVFKDLLG